MNARAARMDSLLEYICCALIGRWADGRLSLGVLHRLLRLSLSALSTGSICASWRNRREAFTRTLLSKIQKQQLDLAAMRHSLTHPKQLVVQKTNCTYVEKSERSYKDSQDRKELEMTEEPLRRQLARDRLQPTKHRPSTVDLGENGSIKTLPDAGNLFRNGLTGWGKSPRLSVEAKTSSVRWSLCFGF